MTPNKDGLRVGPIWLEPGVSYGNFATFLYASLVTIGIVVFVNISQPYILVEKLGVLAGAEGTLTGQLVVVSELTVMLSIGLVGIMSDRIGRRQIFAMGLILFGASYLLYTTVETTPELFAFRIVYALGVACSTAMLGTIINDYPQELSRGKLIAFAGIFLGFGALTTKLFISGIPAKFIANGVDSTAAWNYTHWFVASICFVSAVILATGLKGGTPIQKEQRPSFKELFIRGFSEARKPRTAFAYASAFVARSDLVIIGVFTLLWASSAGREIGLSQAESLARGGMLFGVSQFAGLVWTPVMGIILDRYNRVAALTFGAFLGFVGFTCMFFVQDPFDMAALPFFVMLGIGQISCFLASQVLIGQEAPVEARGAVIGAFGFCGALGILFFTGLGGILFDEWMYAGPFIFVGIASGILGLIGLSVYAKSPGSASA
jgi:MFS family permease